MPSKEYIWLEYILFQYFNIGSIFDTYQFTIIIYTKG